MKVSDVLSLYDFGSEIVDVSSYGNGRINKTYMIKCADGNSYILQMINSNVFKDVQGVMENMGVVSTALTQLRERDGRSSESVLKVVPTKRGGTYCAFDGQYFRVVNFIDNSVCLEAPQNATHMYELGRAIGEFHSDFDGFDASILNITIPNFHNTQARYSKFVADVAWPKSETRATKAYYDIMFLMERSDYAQIIVSEIKKGNLPIRVTHNDTKINNLLFDPNTGKAKALLDFDTIMPDTLLYDVGDAVRSACNMGGEDQEDLTQVVFNKEYYEAFINGYVSEMADKLTKEERDLLPYAPLVMTYELAIRFLNDYVNMDEYFGAVNEDDNLIRARVQMKLLKEMENNFEFICQTTQEALNNQSQF